MGAVADLILLQRIHILNSGNVSLGFHLGKVVVGPNAGNIAEMLLNTGNPTFQTDNLETLPKALEKGLEMARSGFGEKNREFSKQHLSSAKIAQQLLQYYKQLF